jgi:succinyl-CoA synthetase beta subunit
MKLYEYQTKELFQQVGIPTPKGKVIGSATELESVKMDFPLPWVIKSQVRKGGRGKAGLIQFASTEEEARNVVQRLFNHPEKISKLLLEERLDIKKEMYLSIIIDPGTASPLIMACTEGGMEIEEIAKLFPEKIIRERVDIYRGLGNFQARNVMYSLGLQGKQIANGAQVLMQLYRLFRSCDADLAEINPLVITGPETVVAADAKMNIDDNALFRQKRFVKSRDQFDDDLEFEAFQAGLHYIRFDGDIGVMSAGAGLTMTIMDLIHHFGGRPANFLEFGGAAYGRAAKAMDITLKNPKVKVILITTFGLIARADVIAQGIAQAITELKPKIPIVAAVRGTGEEEAFKILEGLGLEPMRYTEEAVKKAVAIAAGRAS